MTKQHIATLRHDGASWRFSLEDVAAFRAALGEDVTIHLLRAFVHTDRLSSLGHMLLLSQEHLDTESVAYTRNLQTTVWFAVGTLREFALAVEALRAALARKGWLDPETPHWVRLREVERRWTHDDFYRTFRDKVSFHVDSEEIAEGLKRLEKHKDLVLAAGDTGAVGHTSFRLGLEALLIGHLPDVDAYGTLFQTVAEDWWVGAELQLALTELLERIGFRPADGPGPEVM